MRSIGTEIGYAVHLDEHLPHLTCPDSQPSGVWGFEKRRVGCIEPLVIIRFLQVHIHLDDIIERGAGRAQNRFDVRHRMPGLFLDGFSEDLVRRRQRLRHASRALFPCRFRQCLTLLAGGDAIDGAIGP